jgi:lysyl-tRNA synthetase class 2
MADSAPTESLANLQLDEVTGEKVSKSELKKRIKLRQKEAEKASRAAAAPPKPVKKTNAEAEEKDLNPNVC